MDPGALPRREPNAFEGTERFTVVARLGAGGMGVVYEAFDRTRGQRVALKTLRAMGPDALLGFKKEFRTLQGISHPNLVTLYELVEERGQWFFTMELVDGVDIVEHVRGPRAGASAARTATLGNATMSIEALAAYAARPAAEPLRVELDEAKLRDAFVQLARGLAALHAAGKVHRDVKPSNTRVTPSGRVVLLDFGVATEYAGASAGIARIAGTAAYMAPEQAAGESVGPAADWYSVGVVLYEALSGRVPFEGTPAELIARKRTADPLPPSTFVDRVPEDLERLCMDLLRREPAARPVGREMLDRLSTRAVARAASDRTTSDARAARDADEAALRALAAAAADAQRGGAVTVLLRGGVSAAREALVRRFLDEHAAREPTAVHLASRCDARELVPYRAVDGIVDALVELAKHEPAPAFQPPRAARLVRAFPVVAQIAPPASQRGATANAAGALDARDERRRMFDELRDWVGRVAEHRPVVMVIDDFDAADGDSLALVRRLVAPPNAPRALFVGSICAPDERLRTALVDGAWGEVREVSVATLETGAAGPGPATAMLAGDAIAASAALGRLRSLDAPARALFDIVALAAGPLDPDAAARAAEQDAPRFARSLEELKRAHLVRSVVVAGRTRLEPIDEALRGAMTAKLDDGARTVLHGRLARAIRATGVDAELEAIHWRDAGDRDAAAEAAIRAATDAEAALAFRRAARLRRLVLDLGSFAPERALAHQLAYADALASAGLSAEAARAYAVAAKAMSGDDALELERRAAELFLTAGRLDEGLAALEGVLASVGMHLPATPPRAALFARRAQLFARGLSFRERPARDVPAAELRRIDVCRSVAQGLGFVDNVRAAHFQALHTLLALRAGEPERVARAAALDAPFVAAMGRLGARRAQALVLLAEQLANRGDDPLLHAFAQFSAGFCALQQGRWAPARIFIDRATATFTERCAGAAWEQFTSRMAALWALFYLGELRELASRAGALVRDALDDGNLFCATNARLGVITVAWLVRGDVAGARRAVATALEAWPKAGYDAQHCFALIANAHIDLYAGDAAAAHARIRGEWSELEGSLFLYNQLIRVVTTHLRAASALGAAARAPHRDGLVDAAERDARRLVRERMPWAEALAELVLAGVAHARAQERDARDRLVSAAVKLDDAQMPLHAAAAEARLGASIGGARGEALAARALDRIAAQRVADPAAIVRMLAPGFGS